MLSGSIRLKNRALPLVWWMLLTLCLSLNSARAQESRRTYRGAESSEAVVPFVFEGPLTDLPTAIRWRPGDPIKEIPRRHYFKPGEKPDIPAPSPRVDPLLELQDRARVGQVADAFVLPLVNRDGQGFSGANPPDTVGDVGLDHYIQVVNTSSGGIFTIYNKADGSVAAGPIALDSLSPGGNCGVGLGDGVVLYDHLADRWLLTEFNNLANSVCVYVSQESNPVTTAWFAYEFSTISFPDYPKYAVWPDAYYLSTNEATSGLYALDRASMLDGAPASTQRFGVPNLAGFGFQALTPGDLDGASLPPAGSPGIFMRHRDTEAHGPDGFPATDFLELWEFSVDWLVPADSRLTGPTNITVTDFDSELCGFFSFTCVPQPSSTVLLDPLREVIMHRLQYRSFDSYETLVGNLVTDVDGNDHAGVRWFELRNSGAGWSLFQEGTYAPDEHHRWMGAIAMDAVGNIALGYNISSSTLFPGLRYTGRLAGDPIGMMGQPETSLIEGAAPNSSNRYGDYSAMSVDPVDDCTFWLTGQYNTAATWSTRIGSFKFDDCALAPGFSLGATPQDLEICSPDDAVFTVDVGSVQGFVGEVTLGLSGEPAGSPVDFDPNPVMAGQSSTLTIGTSPATTPDSYSLQISGTGAPGVSSTAADLIIFAAVPESPALLSPANGTLNQPVKPTFTWTKIGGTYSIEIANDSAFLDIVESASGLTDASYQPVTHLGSESTYYWRVWAENACGVGSMSAIWSFTTLPVAGECSGDLDQTAVFFDDMESGELDWITRGTASTWTLSSLRTQSGSYAWHAEDPDGFSDQYLITEPIFLPTGEEPLTLEFWDWQEIESNGEDCYDGAVVEISVNNGFTWTRLESELRTGPYDGEVSLDYENPIAGDHAWCGDPRDWRETIVDLNAWAGETVKLRFRLATDGSIGAEGWYVDDVGVMSCRDEVFSDGVESGDTSAWSWTYPRF